MLPGMVGRAPDGDKALSLSLHVPIYPSKPQARDSQSSPSTDPKWPSLLYFASPYRTCLTHPLTHSPTHSLTHSPANLIKLLTSPSPPVTYLTSWHTTPLHTTTYPAFYPTRPYPTLHHDSHSHPHSHSQPSPLPFPFPFPFPFPSPFPLSTSIRYPSRKGYNNKTCQTNHHPPTKRAKKEAPILPTRRAYSSTTQSTKRLNPGALGAVRCSVGDFGLGGQGGVGWPPGGKGRGGGLILYWSWEGKGWVGGDGVG